MLLVALHKGTLILNNMHQLMALSSLDNEAAEGVTVLKARPSGVAPVALQAAAAVAAQGGYTSVRLTGSAVLRSLASYKTSCNEAELESLL
eukprot:gene14671-14819_t